MIQPDCRACRGAGLVAPSPFFEDWTPWRAYRLAAAVQRAARGLSREGCAVASGNLRPVACPVCNAGGPVAGNPHAGPDPEPAELVELAAALAP